MISGIQRISKCAALCNEERDVRQERPFIQYFDYNYGIINRFYAKYLSSLSYHIVART